MSETETAPTPETPDEGVPAPEQEAPAPQQSKAPEAGEAQEPEVEAEEKPEPKEKHKPWFQARIDSLTFEKNEERRQRQALEARLAELERGAHRPEGERPEDQPKSQSVTAADVERLAIARAQQIADERAFNAACNRTYQAGIATHPDFQEAVSNIGMLTGNNPPKDFLEAVTELPNGHDVYALLGRDLDRAAAVMGMTPTRRAIELAKLSAQAAQPKAPKPVSKAPAPITPLSGQAKGDPDPDKMSTSEWIAWRDKQAREARH